MFSLQNNLQLLRLGVNLKNFPSAIVPTTYAILFHAGIAAVLLLYSLFWLKVCRPLYMFYNAIEQIRVIILKTVGILRMMINDAIC